MRQINGSAVDNHHHLPLFCTAVVRLLALVFIRPVASSGDTSSLSLAAHVNKYMHGASQRSASKASVRGPAVGVISKSRVSNVLHEGSRRHTVKAAFTQIYFILLFSPSSPLSSPVLQISWTSFSLSPLCGRNSLWSGFLTRVQIGKLQDGELSLVRFMWSQGACGRWGVWEVLAAGAGQSKEDIKPSCHGLTLLMLTAWLTPTAAVMWKGPQCCAALGAPPPPLC